jgi:hypothetical protein
MAFATLRPGIAQAIAEVIGIGATATLPHGLGAAPPIVLINPLDDAGGSSLYLDSVTDVNVVIINADGANPHTCDLTAILA